MLISFIYEGDHIFLEIWILLFKYASVQICVCNVSPPDFKQSDFLLFDIGANKPNKQLMDVILFICIIYLNLKKPTSQVLYFNYKV